MLFIKFPQIQTDVDVNAPSLVGREVIILVIYVKHNLIQ